MAMKGDCFLLGGTLRKNIWFAFSFIRTSAWKISVEMVNQPDTSLIQT